MLNTSLKRLLIRTFSTTNNLNSKLLYEREIRSTLSKLERVISFIPDAHQQSKTEQDLSRLQNQFKDLVFDEGAGSEQAMKKLLTVTKSKFYMLRVNYPKAFEVSVDLDIEQHNPLEERRPEAAPDVRKLSGSVHVDEDETEEAKQRRLAQIG